MYFEFDFLIYRNETGHSCESVSNAKVILNGPLTQSALYIAISNLHPLCLSEKKHDSTLLKKEIYA